MVEREAVRVAALRMLMLTAATPEDATPTDLDESVGRLLLAGYGVRDICAALAIDPDIAHSTILRLAR